MIRKLGGLVAGVALALIIIMSIEALGHQLFPLAAARDPEAPLPFQALAPVVVAWFIGTVAGGIVAVRLGREPWEPWAVAGAIILGEMLAFALTPYPLWMMAAGVVLPLLGAWVVQRFFC